MRISTLKRRTVALSSSSLASSLRTPRKTQMSLIPVCCSSDTHKRKREESRRRPPGSQIHLMSVGGVRERGVGGRCSGAWRWAMVMSVGDVRERGVGGRCWGGWCRWATNRSAVSVGDARERGVGGRRVRERGVNGRCAGGGAGVGGRCSGARCRWAMFGSAVSVGDVRERGVLAARIRGIFHPLVYHFNDVITGFSYWRINRMPSSLHHGGTI